MQHYKLLKETFQVLLITHPVSKRNVSKPNSINRKTSLLHAAAKPSTFMGPVAPFDNGRISRDAYDPRSFIRSTNLPFAQQSAATVAMGKQQERRTTMESEKQARQISQYNRYAPDVAINIDNNPFIMARTGMNKAENISDRIIIDTNLLQATAGIGVAAAAAAAAPGGSAHRKVGAVRYGMSKMY